MAITIDGQPPLIAPGGIAPDAVGTVEIADESIAAIDIADIGKGFLFTGDGAGAINTIAVGTDTYILTADSAEGVGIKWAAPAPVDLSSRVAVAGDTMTGLLTLSGAPTVDLHAATKKYVDDQVSGIDLSPYVVRTGDTMTGTLTMGPGAGVYVGTFGSGSTEAFAKWSTGATDTALAAFVDGEFNERFEIRTDGRLGFGPGSAGLDTFISRSAAGILAMGAGDKLQQNAAPTVDDDLTNKKYVDDEVGAVDLSSRVAVAGDAMTGALTNTNDITARFGGDTVLIGDVGGDAGINLNGSTIYQPAAFQLRTNSDFRTDGTFIVGSGNNRTQIQASNIEQFDGAATNAVFTINQGTLDWDFDDDGTPDVVIDNTASGIIKLTSGKLQSPITPAVDDDVANKKYVDDEVGSIDLSPYLLKAGDTMSGALTMGSNNINSIGIGFFNTRAQAPQFRLESDGVLNAGFGSGDTAFAQSGETTDSFFRFEATRHGGLKWGDGTVAPGDVTVERGSPNTLDIDSDVYIKGSNDLWMDAGSDFNAQALQLKMDNGRIFLEGGEIRAIGGSAATDALGIGISGDTSYRLLVEHDGDLQFGPGNAGPDVRLGWSAANIIAMSAGDKIQQNEPPAVDDDLTNKKYVDDGLGGLTAADIANVPAFSVVATDVQAAIDELATEKLQKAGGTMTGSLLIATGANIIATGTANFNVFEAKVQGNINESFSIDADGELNWDTDVDGNSDVTMTAVGTRIDMGTGNQIRVDADPDNANALARKSYVDASTADYLSFEFFESEAASTTTSDVFQDKINQTTAALVSGGLYEIDIRASVGCDKSSTPFEVKVDLTGSLVKSRTKSVVGSGNNDETQLQAYNDKLVVTAASSTAATIKLQYREPGNSDLVNIEDAIITIKRVG